MMQHFLKEVKILAVISTFASMQFGHAQIIENYEATPLAMSLIKGGTTDLSTLTVVSNPVKSGTNTSNKVCKLFRDKDGIPEEGFSATKTIDFATQKYLHIKVYKNRLTAVKLKLEGGTNGTFASNSTNTQTKINQWEDYVFDCNSLSGLSAKFTVIPDYKDPVGLSFDTNIYIDDIVLNDNAAPITYTTELFQNSYQLYKNIRQSNGVYLDALAINGAGDKPAAIVANGIGLMALCISDAMYTKTGDAVNWEPTADQVIATLQAFVDFKANGIANGAGMFPRYFRWDSGNQDGDWSGEFSTVDNAIFAMGLHMCTNYFANNATIVANANSLLATMDFTKAIYPTKMAMILDQSGTVGSAFTSPFNEYMLVSWMAKNAPTSNVGYAKSQTFWNTYFANPDTALITRPTYFGYTTLSDGDFISSFIPQFCYYFVHYFKSDSKYMSYFSNWLNADKLFATKEGATNTYEWGLGAGEIPRGGYSADKIYDNPNKIVSPHIIAGFIPINSSSKTDLVSLFNNGNGAAVYGLPSNTAKKVLWRYKRDDTAARTPYIQAIDYSTMLFGLASLPENLGSNWFSNYNWPLTVSNLETKDWNKKEPKITVYPNPFAQSITITFQNFQETTATISDVSGKQVFSLFLKQNSQNINLPSDLQSGVYFLQIKNEKPIKIIKK